MFLLTVPLYIVGMDNIEYHSLLAPDEKDNDRAEMFRIFEKLEYYESRKMMNLAIKQISDHGKISQRTATVLLMAIWEYQMLSPDEQLSRRKLGEQILSTE